MRKKVTKYFILRFINYIDFIKDIFYYLIYKQDIALNNKNIIIYSTSKNTIQIKNIKEIKEIIYGFFDNKYYFTVVNKNEIFCSKCVAIKESEEIFFEKKINCINILKQSEEHNIPLIPSIFKCEPIFSNACTTIYSYCIFNKDKYLLTLYQDNNNLVWIHKEEEYIDNNFEINKLLENPYNFFKSKKKKIKKSIKKKFRLKILDKELTLNRGYGLYPVFNNKIITKDIYYSFDEEEIKNKIIEFLSPSYNGI